MTSYGPFLGVIFVYCVHSFGDTFKIVGTGPIMGLYSFNSLDLLQFSSLMLVDPPWILTMVLLSNMEQTGMLNLVGVCKLPKCYLKYLAFFVLSSFSRVCNRIIQNKLFDVYLKLIGI